MSRLISIITPCFNEEANVAALHDAVRAQFAQLPGYRFEHVFIDNASKDQTVPILKKLAERHHEVGVIVNSRNFGHIRSPFHALRDAQGDAAILLAADFQDPPDVIPKLLKKWEEGFPKVLLVKEASDETLALRLIRRAYYRLVGRLSDVELIKNATGSGLYDRGVIDILRQIDDPYPYFRGLVQDIGFDTAQVLFRQPKRRRGISKNNFYSLYDIAMAGITAHSKIPLRVATFLGLGCSIASALSGLAYLVYRFVHWDQPATGSTPFMIGVLFVSSIQLFFLGVIGEYVGAIQTQVMKRPLVIEKGRFGFTGRSARSPLVS